MKKFQEITVGKREELLKYEHRIRGWVFRGQRDQSWPLKTSFERARTGTRKEIWRDLEKEMMSEFKRRAHHYISDLPREEDHLEWLALMQHHGCPTRLLDFTRSFYVALYFAIEDAQDYSAVWAINSFALGDNAPSAEEKPLYTTYSKEAEKEANDILSPEASSVSLPGVRFVEPKRMNERLSIQQGLFGFPKDLSFSFEKNLSLSLKAKSLDALKKQDSSDEIITKIIIPKEMHAEIALWLSTMNITAATLFPGLDGFAKSQMIGVKYALYDEQMIGKLREQLLAGSLWRERTMEAMHSMPQGEGGISPDED